MSLFKKLTTTSMPPPENQECICGARPNVTIESLRCERDALKLRKLQCMKENELCDAACKSTCARYHSVKAERGVNRSLSGQQDAIAQLADECTQAFDCRDHSNPRITVMPPPEDYAPLSRQLTPYPGLMENNQRVLCHHSTTKQSPVQNHPASGDVTPASSDPPEQDLSRISTASTMVTPTIGPESGVLAGEGSPKSRCRTRKISISSPFITPQLSPSQIPILKLPSSALNSKYQQTQTQTQIQTYSLPTTPQSYATISFHAHHLAVRRDVSLWERRCGKMERVFRGVRDRCEEELGEGWDVLGDRAKEGGEEGGSCGTGKKGEGKKWRKAEVDLEKEERKWVVCGLDLMELVPIRRVRAKLRGKFSHELS